MIEAGLKAGDIFTWQNYPYYIKEFKRQRWLLYLGNNSIEAIVYQISTTTQYEHYNKDGDRKRNYYFELPAGMGGLEEKSILGLSFFERIPEADLNKFKVDITKKHNKKAVATYATSRKSIFRISTTGHGEKVTEDTALKHTPRSGVGD